MTKSVKRRIFLRMTNYASPPYFRVISIPKTPSSPYI